MHEQNEQHDLQIVDVNQYDSQVWVRFEDGRTVTLSGQQILAAATEQCESANEEEANGSARKYGEGTESPPDAYP